MKRIEMTGKQYGFLTILLEDGKYVTARCQCGIEKRYYRTNILTGYTQSCGCYRDSQTSKANTTHGLSQTPTYQVWKQMRQRCNNPLKDSAHRYGGRGITYDPRWDHYENFLADMGERPEGLELDRIDNNGNYCKENCRWTTHKINCNNK